MAAFPNAPGQQADASTNSSPRNKNTYGALARGRGDEPSADNENDGAVGFKMKPGARRLDAGSAARFFYCAKASKSERNHGLADPGHQFEHGTSLRQVEDAPKAGNHHPTVKPLALIQYLQRLVTPPGGLTADIFMGSGTSAVAARREGFSFVGAEMQDDYFAIAQARDAAEAAQ